jgi:hypothetical protein
VLRFPRDWQWQVLCLLLLAGASMNLDMQRKRLDAARARYTLLRRKMEGEFTALDSLAAKVEELESLRKVSVTSDPMTQPAMQKACVSLHSHCRLEPFACLAVHLPPRSSVAAPALAIEAVGNVLRKLSDVWLLPSSLPDAAGR